jgi:hypothetical protein
MDIYLGQFSGILCEFSHFWGVSVILVILGIIFTKLRVRLVSMKG